MKTLNKLLIFLLQSAVVGLAAAFLVVLFRPELLGGGNGRSLPARASYADAVALSAPAVVNVHTAKRVEARVPAPFNNPLLRDMLGDRFAPRERIETSLGSGVIVSPEGHVLTNYHVIREADAIQVALADGRVARATVVGTDVETDLALLHIELRDLPVAPLGDSAALRSGDVVLAVGSPFGLGQTVTQGIVSATGRSNIGLTLFENFIQTDAAINVGNSGGALINTRGEVVGINTALLSQGGGSNGIGFAIPVNLARGVMQQLIEHGRVIRGWLGVTPQPLTPDLAEAFRLNELQGVLVSEIVPDSPAQRAGLRTGDVITHIAGQPVNSFREALNRVAAMQPGTEIEIRGIRQGRRFTVTAVVGERQQ